MSAHINKLTCGPRALMVIAEKLGKPIDPDLMWEKFFSNAKTDGVVVSKILDIAREFGIANDFDLTADAEHAAFSIRCDNVAGILILTERIPGPRGEFDSTHRHVWALHRIHPDIAIHNYQFEVESANQGQESRIDRFPFLFFHHCLCTFLILLK